MSAAALEKATISKLTKDNSVSTTETLKVMFNPKELTFSKQNNWKQNNSPKENIPSGEFTGGGAETLKVQLYFDTYTSKDQKDVREEYTRKITRFMQIDPDTVDAKSKKGRPPLVRFQWTDILFDGVISTVNERLTLFLPSGKPVRAVLDLTLTQIKDDKSHKKQNPTSGGVGGERVWTVREGDTLSWIAFVEYDNAADWRRIADANRLTSVRSLRPGTTLVIPNA
jgi:nucleoid-associated protein YgaU